METTAYESTQEVPLKIIKHARGARIVDGDDVISEIRAQPGPTHTLFDVLAACIAGLAEGPRIAVLGFAGGGIVAPLRAMQCNAELQCVDLSLAGEKIFRKLSAKWAGKVRVDRQDASRWLRRKRTPFDCILEDLSLPATAEREGVKPDISLHVIPPMMAESLTPDGVVIINMLPMPGMTWNDLMIPFTHSFRRVCVIHFEGYVNRVVVAGKRLATASEVSRRIRAELHSIESAMAFEFCLRTLARGD